MHRKWRDENRKENIIRDVGNIDRMCMQVVRDFNMKGVVDDAAMRCELITMTDASYP